MNLAFYIKNLNEPQHFRSSYHFDLPLRKERSGVHRKKVDHSACTSFEFKQCNKRGCPRAKKRLFHRAFFLLGKKQLFSVFFVFFFFDLLLFFFHTEISTKCPTLDQLDRLLIQRDSVFSVTVYKYQIIILKQHQYRV